MMGKKNPNEKGLKYRNWLTYIGGWIVLKWSLEKYDLWMYTGLTWVRMWSSDGLMRRRQWSFRFHRSRRLFV